MTHIEAMKQGLEALEEAVHYTSAPVWSPSMTKECNEAIASLRQAIAEAEKQEPVAWKWHQAPVKTSWGHDMVVADLAIDKNNTVSVYCERDQTTKVEAMFSTPPQRTEQEQQIETLKRCLFQMQEAAKDLVEQAKSLTPPQRTKQEPVIDKSAAIRIATALGWEPQREWAGLTDEQIDEIWRTHLHRDSRVRAIEAKLKQKNGYAKENT